MENPLARPEGRASSGAIVEDGEVATILVVEDERDIRDLLRRYLERAGHSVLTSGTGADERLYLSTTLLPVCVNRNEAPLR